ncbi:hypothetical protein B0H13DRAFT_1549495, partial [Mycena leptocephala]
QNHMGKHILLSARGIQESNLITPVMSSVYPCGFCGKTTSSGGCTIAFRGGKALSPCCEVYEFQIAAPSKSSASKPCTNVPIRCALCSDTHWKYNMAAHLRDSHPNWEL